jgi:Fe-Mn family superoxide dismutase
MIMFILPRLPYAFDALEPHIDARTMEIHYTKHHQSYIDNLNAALQHHVSLQDTPITDLLRNLNTLPEAVRVAVRNQGGGHFNHSFFWPLMQAKSGGEPVGTVAKAIATHFGAFHAFQATFNTAAKSVFGSGWAWLSVDAQRDLLVHTTANQDSPIAEGKTPILGLDVWEHAYYLKYQNKRPDYIAAWWQVINWDQVEENYRAVI